MIFVFGNAFRGGISILHSSMENETEEKLLGVER